MKLWIDDLRPAPDGWKWAKNSADAIKWLAFGSAFDNPIDTISFDHDLGGDDTTRAVVNWLCYNGWGNIEAVYCHSSNPPGKEWIEEMVKRYAPPGTLKRW